MQVSQDLTINANNIKSCVVLSMIRHSTKSRALDVVCPSRASMVWELGEVRSLYSSRCALTWYSSTSLVTKSGMVDLTMIVRPF